MASALMLELHVSGKKELSCSMAVSLQDSASWN